MQTTTKLRRLVVLALMAFATAAWLPVSAQTSTDKPVTLSLQKANVKDFFREMKKLTGLDFICGSELVRQLPLVTVSVKDVPAERVLSDVLGQIGCKYTIDGSIVTITHRDQTGRTRHIEGTVRDDQGEPLPGAIVRVKGNSVQVVTDNDGRYTISAPTGACQLEYAYLGMLTHTADFAQGTADVRQTSAPRIRQPPQRGCGDWLSDYLERTGHRRVQHHQEGGYPEASHRQPVAGPGGSGGRYAG